MKKFLLTTLCLLSAVAMAFATEYKMTPNNDQTGLTNTAYVTTATTFTVDGIKWRMNQWNPSTLQVKTNETFRQNEFYFANVTEFDANVTSVVLKFSALTLKDTNASGWFLTPHDVAEVAVGDGYPDGSDGSVQGVWDATFKTLTFTLPAGTPCTYFCIWQNKKVATGTNKLAAEDAITVNLEGGEVSYTFSATESGNYYSGQEVAVKCTNAKSLMVGYTYTSSNGEGGVDDGFGMGDVQMAFANGDEVKLTLDHNQGDVLVLFGAYAYDQEFDSMDDLMASEADQVASFDELEEDQRMYSIIQPVDVVFPDNSEELMPGTEIELTCENAQAIVYTLTTAEGASEPVTVTGASAKVALNESCTVSAYGVFGNWNGEEKSQSYTVKVLPVQQYVLTPIADLVSGDVVIIVDEESSTYLPSSAATNAGPAAEAITITDGKISSAAPSVAFTVTVADGKYSFVSYADDEYTLSCAIKDNNGVRVTKNPANNSVSVFDWDATANRLTFPGQTTKGANATRYLGVYYASDEPTNWRTYTSTSQFKDYETKGLLFYKQVAAEPEPEAEYYLVGDYSNDGWKTRTKFEKQENGTYTLHFDEFAGAFKICPDATSWDNSWGHNGAIALGEDVALDYGTNPSNIAIDGNPTLTNVDMVLTPGEGDALTLKITGTVKVVVPEIYIVGEELGWSADSGLKLTEKDGVYEGSTNVHETSFKVITVTSVTSWYGINGDTTPAYNVAMPLNGGDNISLPEVEDFLSYKFVVTVDANYVPQTVTVTYTTGINNINVDADAEYYNMQGVRVLNPTEGIYIVRRGNAVTKQVVRK